MTKPRLEHLWSVRIVLKFTSAWSQEPIQLSRLIRHVPRMATAQSIQLTMNRCHNVFVILTIVEMVTNARHHLAIMTSAMALAIHITDHKYFFLN